MGRRWAAFRGAIRDQLLNTWDQEEECGRQLASHSGPLYPEMED